MINLLKIEWLKIKNYTGFILLASFFVVGVGACNYIVYLFIKNVLDKVEVSKLSAHSTLAREFVDFLEHDLVYVIEAVYNILGSLVLL